MKTTVIGSNKSNAKLESANKTGNKNEQAKTNGLPLSKEFDDKPKGETEPKKAEAPKAETVQPQAEQAKPETPKAEAEQPKTEASKTEIKQQLAEQRPVLNLESTLKLVEELHRRKIQRDKLLTTIETLEEFEVAQKDDAEETDSNHFQGCELTIEDDKRRQFSTKNPYIIKKVAEYINTLCMDKLTEIEGEIFIPA